MSRFIYWLFAALLLFFGRMAIAQDSLLAESFKSSLSGYIRSIHLVQHVGDIDKWYVLNGLHGRMNLTHSFSASLRVRMDLRTQFLFGSGVEESPLYANGFRQSGESADLHALWWKRPTSAGYSNVERLYLEHQKKELTLIVGRQRIHWGMSLGWNPADLFQVGNPFDPDYVERPGADAIRIIRSIGPLSGVELAVARTGPGLTRGAWRYYTNRSGYDVQFIAGWLDRQPVFAGGWSGSLGNWSFRGEVQGLIPLADEPHQWQFVLETDRLLSHNKYIRASVLYNDNGVVGGREVPVFIPTPKQLMPGKWNAMIGWSQEPSFRLTYGVDLFYTSAAGTVVFFPRMEWSFSGNWSASLFIQIAKSFISQSSFEAGFIRLERRISK